MNLIFSLAQGFNSAIYDTSFVLLYILFDASENEKDINNQVVEEE